MSNDDNNSSKQRYPTSFYLASSTSSTLSKLTTLTPKANRSTVMNASLEAFDELKENAQRRFLRQAADETADEDHRAVGLSLTPLHSKIINKLTNLVPECNRSMIVKAAVLYFDQLSKAEKINYVSNI